MEKHTKKQYYFNWVFDSLLLIFMTYLILYVYNHWKYLIYDNELNTDLFTRGMLFAVILFWFILLLQDYITIYVFKHYKNPIISHVEYKGVMMKLYKYSKNNIVYELETGQFSHDKETLYKVAERTINNYKYEEEK